MEPNNPNTQQGRGTQPPPKSPPQPGASMQPTSAAGNEQRSEPNAETGSAESGASEFAVEMKNAAKAKVKEGTDNAKRAVTSTVSHGSEALGRAADTLRDQGEETLAKTTTSIATGLSEYAERLEKRSTEDLIQDLARLARQNPTIFVLGSVGIGIALSRFFKASARSTRGHG